MCGRTLMTILSASAWLLAGIGLCLCLPAPPDAVLLSMIGALVLVSACRPHWRPLSVVAAGVLLAGLHASWSLSRQLPVSMEHGTFVLTGIVSGMPMHEVRRTRFEFVVDDADAMPTALRGARLRLAWYDDFDAEASAPDAPRLRVAAGSRWTLSAKLRAPRGLRNPGGVDGEKHAFVDRIVATGYVRAPETAQALGIARGIDAWRETMSQRIERTAPAASSRFLRALALGDTRGLADEDWAVLRANGLTHLIAISGFHVGLVAGFFALLASVTWWMFPLLGRIAPRTQAAALSALAGAAIYAAMAGFALPTVRTLLMIAVVAIARLSRRTWRPWSAVAMSVVAMLVVDPLAVLTAGFWLSFGGVAWLLWCLPDGGGRPVRDFLSAQAVATVGLLPLTVALFGQASLAGPFANLLAIPWWSLVVVPLSLIGLALEALHAGWGDWAWRLATWAFDPSWSLFEGMAGSPLALWWLPEARWYALPLALLSAFWCLLPRALPGKPFALLLWLPLLWPDRAAPAPGEVEIVVLDVGQGLSVLVRTANHQLLYDMGPAIPEGFDAGERAVVPALRALGVRRLDAAVLSHGDNDHAGGFESVAAAFPMQRVFAPEGSGLSARVRALRTCRAGTAWTWDGVRLSFLHPTPHFPYLRNESSCVLRIEGAHGAALLTGDIGHVIERGLLRHDPAAIRADVVLMAHHGSDSSSDPGFVAATGARFAPVSAGYGNRFRHPKPAVVERWRFHGARTPVTADSGAQRLRLTTAGVVYEDERTRHRRLWDAVARRARAAE
jgi:competence protein ComEC